MKKLSLVLVLLLTACATSGTSLFSTPPEPASGFATMVIYREKGFTGSFVDHEYYVNDELVAKLGTETYTYLTVKPGKVRVQWGVGKNLLDDGKSKSLAIEALPGKTYYYKEGLTTTSVVPLGIVTVLPMETKFGFIDPNSATQELVTYRLVKPIIEVLK